MESRLSLRLSLRFSPTGLDLGLIQAELLDTPPSLAAPPVPTADPVQVTPSPPAFFSTLILTVWRLRADGGGRSSKSFKNKKVSARRQTSGSQIQCSIQSRINVAHKLTDLSTACIYLKFKYMNTNLWKCNNTENPKCEVWIISKYELIIVFNFHLLIEWLHPNT